MTIDEVNKRLVFEMVQLTGHFEDQEIYQTYIQRALVIGMDYFTKGDHMIIAFDESGVEMGRFKTILQASERLKINPGSISNILHGKRHSARGLTFIFDKPINLD
jgi:hypothetical protein